MMKAPSRMNIAVFASGRGTNFSALLRAAQRGIIKANISLLVCDNPKAPVLAKARRAGVQTALLKRQDFKDRQDFEAQIISRLRQNRVDLIALAGFMRILGPGFVKEYSGRIINIHPALLPAFKGAHAIEDAFNYGVKVTGVTVHFVDEEMDHGPIILQEAVKIADSDTVESLEKKIHRIEHKLYPLAIRLFTQGRIKTEGRKVKIL